MTLAGRSSGGIVAGYALLLAAWVLCAAPFSAPDEWSHYLRAVGIGEGHLLGEPVASFHDPALTPAQEAWVAQAVRAVKVPAGLSPDGYGCNAFHAEASAACIERIPPPPAVPVVRNVVTGTYQPAAFLLPGFLVKLAKTPPGALSLARAANALTCLALLALALAAISGPSLPGFLLALTPMAIYLAASLNPTGPEVAAAVAFGVGLLALGRDRAPMAWPTVAIGGASLCLCRSLGPLFVFLIAPCALLCSLPGALAKIRSAPRSAAFTAAAIGLAAAANRLWEARYGPKLRFPRSEPAAIALREAARSYPEWLREGIGVFQYTDSSMPLAAYLLWSFLVAAAIALALWRGTGRERWALLLAILLALSVPLLLEAFVLRPIGWVVQGRHVLPVAIIVPLVAGEIVGRHADRLDRRLFAAFCAGVCFVCSALQIVAVYADAHRSAVGSSGSWFFPFHPAWSPPAGFWLPLATALAGSVILATSAERSTRVAEGGAGERQGSISAPRPRHS